MEEFGLIKDFAVIMMVAGAVTLIFRRLHQPTVLGYLIAGVIVGPYTLPVPPVSDVETIRLLADLGLVLLLFGLGLEFSWSKIRQIGLSVLLIGGLEICTMISLGYGLGRLMGWSDMNALFLGAAMHISSSAIIVKVLRDMGRLNFLSSRIIVGILVVEDFAAVAIIALLSGIAATGTADLGDIGLLTLRLVVFIVSSLVLGTFIVPRIIRFAHQFRSKEALLITGLGLCFAMALLSRYLELSVAAGAFLIGALIGDTEHSEEIDEVVTPIRDMFAALFFVAIGMLINMAEFGDFIVPAIIVGIVFMLGKFLSNTIATLMSGHDGRTSLQVGMGMPQMGEFSLAIVKSGVEHGVIMSSLSPVIAMSTAITSLVAPYITRSTDSVAGFLDRRSPTLLKVYVSRLADWLQVLSTIFVRDSEAARKVRHSAKIIIINLLIIVVIIGVGTFALHHIENLSFLKNIRADFIGLGIGFVLLLLCMPSFIVIWRSLRSLVDEAVASLLSRRSSARGWRRDALRIMLRDSILIALTIFVAIWFIPFVSALLHFGSLTIAIPLILLAVILYIVLNSVRHIHRQLEQNFSQILLGEQHTSTLETAKLLGISESKVADLMRKMKLKAARKRGQQYTDNDKGENDDE